MAIYTLFGQANPGSVTSGTGNNGTNGLHFTVSQSCTLQGIWHYSPGTSTQLPTSIGLYTITALGTSGTLVTSNSASWSGAAGSGWVFASFTSPPALSPGTDYMATQFRNDAANEWFVFYAVTWPVTSGILTAPKDESTSALSQGWYNIGTAMAFPTTQSGTTGDNFGMDVQVSSGGGDVPGIAPSPVWLGHFKPGQPKPRPTYADSTKLVSGPLNVVVPPPVTSLSGTLVRPQDVPGIAPGPIWFMLAKPGILRPHPQPLGFALSGENGSLNFTLPAPAVSLTGTVVRPQDVPAIFPGTAWLRKMKPGLQRPFPVTPVSGVQFHSGPLNALLPGPSTSLSSQHVHSPENLGAVLALPGPDAVSVEVLEGASFTLPALDATLVLPSLGAHLVGWTMQTAPLNLLEFNDVTINIAVTTNGSPYNLTGATLNLLFKTAAGTPDANALTFSSGGGSPAITITNAVGGLATAVIPNADLQTETYGFYRLDVVVSGLINTALSGPITWTSL